MYSTCLFCHAALGANEVVERFPVGRCRALEGELAWLEAAWKEAEELATIADALPGSPGDEDGTRHIVCGSHGDVPGPTA